jgi:hypothetical protein
VAFLDASFKDGSVCGVLLGTSPPDSQRHRLQAAAITTHDLGLETQTQLRLLAPAAFRLSLGWWAAVRGRS